MFALTMYLRMPGPVDGLIEELESTPSSSRRARLIRKLALCHMPQVIDTISPFLAGEGRVLAASIDALVSFGEDARAPMLEILASPHRREQHRGAMRVLAEIVRADTCRSADPWRARAPVAR